jgi:hypothetical protein
MMMIVSCVDIVGATLAGNLLQFLKNTKDINYCVQGDVFDHCSCQSIIVNETVLGSCHEANTFVLEDKNFDDFICLGP